MYDKWAFHECLHRRRVERNQPHKVSHFGRGEEMGRAMLEVSETEEEPVDRERRRRNVRRQSDFGPSRDSEGHIRRPRNDLRRNRWMTSRPTHE
jgi:hypothetical protein